MNVLRISSLIVGLMFGASWVQPTEGRRAAVDDGPRRTVEEYKRISDRLLGELESTRLRLREAREASRPYLEANRPACEAIEAHIASLFDRALGPREVTEASLKAASEQVSREMRLAIDRIGREVAPNRRREYLGIAESRIEVVYLERRFRALRELSLACADKMREAAEFELRRRQRGEP